MFPESNSTFDEFNLFSMFVSEKWIKICDLHSFAYQANFSQYLSYGIRIVYYVIFGAPYCSGSLLHALIVHACELLLHFVQTNETPAKIFLINCLYAIQQPLLRHDVASEYVKKLGEMIETHVHGLVEKEVDTILRRCGLSNKMSYFRNLSNDESVSREPLAELEDTAPTSLSDGLKAFFGLILGSENSLPEFEQMQVPRLRSEASVQVARSLAEAYELIYNALMDPENRYPDPKSLARHPPDQIRTILGI